MYALDMHFAVSSNTTQSSVSTTAAFRERSFCFCNSIVKPSTSTVQFFSEAINCVKSNGKPYVSLNSNASAPAIQDVFTASLFMISSIRFKPLSRVLKNPFSSSSITFDTNSSCDFNSGKTEANWFAMIGSN